MNRVQNADRRPNALSPFGQTLETALKRYSDATWLGQNSPLAMPYVLHSHLDDGATGAAARGKALQTVLRRAVEQMGGDEYRTRYQTIIREYYFRNRSERELFDLVHLKRNAFHTSRKRAIMALEEALIAQLNPAIRLEAPLLTGGTLFGRTRARTLCVQALQDGQTLVITGSGGVGKTTLGSHVARQWTRGRVFWFTIRPGLTDQPMGLLYALGYFFHRCGESSLWQDLVAQAGQLQLAHALTVLHYALAQLKRRDQTPLLCVDEVDLLQPTEKGDHAQILTLLNSLRGLAPLLLIGQQALLDADQVCRLDGLGPEDVVRMLRHTGVDLTDTDRQRLYAYTQGNPLLVALFSALYASGESIPVLLRELSAAPPLEFLLSRIAHRLEHTARGVLMELAVYRHVAPADVWHRANTAPALRTLMQHRLVQEDGQGGLILLPAYRTVLYNCLPDEKRRALHVKAAQVAAERGAYTEAAYHWIGAEQLEQAIWLWRAYQQQEINQGRGGAALHLFRSIKTRPLDVQAKEVVTLICAHLERLTGGAPQALEDLHSILWQTPILAVEADMLEGVIANDRSEFGHAERVQQRALATAEQLAPARLAHLHKGLGWMHMRTRALDAAWREAQLARYEAENFQGYVAELRCHYADAEAFYRAALDVARALGHKEGIAKTCHNLAGLYARLGRFEAAIAHLREADECLEQIGKITDLLSAQINWAFVFNLAGQHDPAVAALQKARAQFRAYNIELPPWQDALIQQGLAEAYLGLADLDAAQQHVERAIALEEEDILPDSYRTYGEIMLQRNRLDEAERTIRLSLDLLARDEEPDSYLSGYAWRVLAQVHAAHGDQAAAQHARRMAIESFQDIHLSYEIEKTEWMLDNVTKS